MGQDPQDQTSDQNSTPKREGSALLLKAKAGTQERQARSVSLTKALRLTLAKVANDLMGMAMAVIGARVETRAGEGLSDLFGAENLLVLLEGPQRRRGAAVLDRALVGGLLQQQTVGSVSPVEEGDARPMTATDAAVCAPFLDALLSRAADLPEDPGEKALLKGYQFGARVPNARLLLMSLDEARYEIVHLTVDVAGGVRQGMLTLCLPVIVTETLPGGPDGSGKDTSKQAAPLSRLDKTVLALEVDLNVALTRLKMPLGDVQKLAIGDVIDLGVSAFDRASVQTRDGRRLSRGVLGHIDGVRALQMEHAVLAQREPRRRQSDRAELNLPQVIGDGTGTQKAIQKWNEDEHLPIEDLVTPDAGSQVDALPDMSDLPGMSGLPDMSDLSGFDAEDEDALPRVGAG